MGKKLLVSLTLALIFCFLFTGTPALAEDGQIEEQLRQSGIEELMPLIPEGGADLLDEGLWQGDLSGWTPKRVFSWIWGLCKDRLSKPVTLLSTLCGILLLSALLKAFTEGMEQMGSGAAFTTVSTLCISASLVSAVTPVIREAARVIEDLSAFMIGFIPVFTSVAAVSGRPASAAAYQSVTFAAAQFFSQLASNLILPLTGIFLAICTVGAVSDAVDVQGIAQGVKSAAGWVLGLCLTVFVALMTLQSLTAGAADTVGNRAVKFVISSTIPVVGGALSEAYSSLSGYLGLVKSVVGVFGIVVMIGVFLPTLITIGMAMLALNLAGYVGEVLDQKRAAGVIRSVSSALSVLGGLILCYGMMILSTAAILLWMGTPE